MGLRRRLTFAGVVFGLVSGVACRKPTEDTTRPPPAPVDHLAPGESPEGKEKAFGLPLPRLANIEARFEKSIVVRSALSREELSGFVRARVQSGTVTDTDDATTLDDVAPKAAPQVLLDIEVRTIPPVGTARSEMTLRDVTPPPVEPGLSDTERWRRAGFGPGGGVLDPTKLE